MRTSRFLISGAFALAALAMGAGASAQNCPAGRACFYVPPSMPTPPGYTVDWDLVIAAPRAAVSGTYRIGTAAAVPFTVMPGTPLRVDLSATQGTVSNYNVSESRGIFIDASSSELVVDHRLIVGPWQSSSTIKAHTFALGTRFRPAGYSLNGSSTSETGHDMISVYAPFDGTMVTFSAPPGAPATFWGDGITGATRTVTLSAGQTYMIRTIAGCAGNVNGALVTSNMPIAVESGGRGWSSGAAGCVLSGSCGDDGADALLPVTGVGQQYVVDDYPSTGAEGERVHVIADTDNTQVRVNGMLVATLMAGRTHTFQPSGVTYVETSAPAYVYEESGLSSCETDLAIIPPLSFAPVALWTVDILVVGSGRASVVIPTTSVATLRLDGAVIVPVATNTVPGRPDLTRVQFNVTGNASAPGAQHRVTAMNDFQLGLVTSAGGTGLFAYYTPFRVPGCGDGMRSATEACDDGNVANGDGCSEACRIEVGYAGCMNDTQCVATGRCDMNRCVARCRNDADCLDTNDCTNDMCNTATGVCASSTRPQGASCVISAGTMGVCRVPTGVPPACVQCLTDANCPTTRPVCSATAFTCSDPDVDMDGLTASQERALGTNPNNPDTDMDGIRDGAELGTGGVAMPRDTDGDRMIDALDPDDDGDGVLTSAELGTGGAMSPRNTDAMAAPGRVTTDMNPDYLDPDDDGDGIPTSVERVAEGMTPGDMDMVAAWLDLDSDGDGDFDRDEVGPTPATPANTDGAMDRADFLDTDSDNDCLADSDTREDGAARTNARLPSMDANANCPRAMPICNTATGLCGADMDRDMDGILDMDEVRLGTNPTNPDTDMDGIRDGAELGTGGVAMPRDTDGDRMIDALDNDDDGDGILTRDELGAGGAMMPRNSDATVPTAEGTSDAVPDYLDNDDDGDGIPTAAERTLDTSANDDRDGDMVPSHLDRDADGDGDFDREEAGATPATPANTDGLMDGPDFLDTDSDNDCAGDNDPRENGAARVTVPTPVDGNCSGATPVCDRAASVCVACLVTGGMSRGCATSTAGRVCIVPAGDAGAAMSFCGCRLDGDCAMDQMCNVATNRCVMRAMPDAGPDAVIDAGPDAAVDVASDLGADTGADTGVDAAVDVAMDAAVDVTVEDVAVADAAGDAAVDALADAVPATDGPTTDAGVEDSGAEDVATTDATPADDTGPVADGGAPTGGVEYRGGGCACSVPNGTAPSRSNALFLLGLGVIPALVVRRRRAARRERGASPS